MNASEIITIDAKHRGVDPELLLRIIHRDLKSGEAILLMHGKTVLFVRRIGPGMAEPHLFSQDNAHGLVSAIKHFAHEFHTKDVHMLYINPDGPEILNLLRAVGEQVHPSNNPKYKVMVPV